MNEKHKKVCGVLNYMDHLLIIIPAVTECAVIATFVSFVGNPIGITSSAIWLKICVINALLKFLCKKSINKKNKKKHDKIVLLTKSKLNSIKVLVSSTLIDSNISHDEFALINNALKEFYDKKKEIKYSNSNDK